MYCEDKRHVLGESVTERNVINREKKTSALKTKCGK